MEAVYRILPAVCLLLASTYAQDTSTDAASSTPSNAATTTGVQFPSTPTDNANGSQDDDGNNDNHGMGGLVNYYFVFFALLMCIVALGTFLCWRRKRKMGLMVRNGRESALERDLDAWDPARSRRRYWQGGWRSNEEQHVEGLNEHGEAPPPYMPKARDDEEGTASRANEPAVPMQTLSREQAGLKPPEYMVSTARPVDEAGGGSSAGASNGPQPGEYRQQWR